MAAQHGCQRNSRMMRAAGRGMGSARAARFPAGRAGAAAVVGHRRVSWPDSQGGWAARCPRRCTGMVLERGGLVELDRAESGASVRHFVEWLVGGTGVDLGREMVTPAGASRWPFDRL
ncbi:hypothetical protein E2562_025986 [Oryza meyeriana var. granulata]|uniref:Uncharacterized protein n=1 Tax=Oryza meyeriana var. granulata TaxID=110450 RepID=A0A6G1EPD9_9ORYZ|nr:hypothetical protein E2562_025986 [Oryza meyeriana var. granulata]